MRAAFGLSAIRWIFMLGQLNAVFEPERQERMSRSAGEPYPDLVARVASRTVFLLELIDGA